MKLIVAGGCGFIGSNFVRHTLKERDDIEIEVFDLLTYAGNLANLEDIIDDDRLSFTKGDIADRAAVADLIEDGDVVVNFAAESHVDRSIIDARPFIHTNVEGTQVLLDVSLEKGVERFVQISTDEVYGSLGDTGQFKEDTPLAPNSPYSASKAAADLLVRAYGQTHDLPVVTIRSSNAYGPYQFPEKLIPLMVTNAFRGEPLPVYGDGKHVRDWIHVLDFCSAILAVVERGRTGEIYNAGGGNEIQNIDVVRKIIELTEADTDLLRFVSDRPGHDRRYAMNHDKLTAELGWEPSRDFQSGLRQTVEWYKANRDWVESVRSGAYRDYYETQYAGRLEAADTVQPE